jgi:hypothetical protein
VTPALPDAVTNRNRASWLGCARWPPSAGAQRDPRLARGLGAASPRRHTAHRWAGGGWVGWGRQQDAGTRRGQAATQPA